MTAALRVGFPRLGRNARYYGIAPLASTETWGESVERFLNPDKKGDTQMHGPESVRFFTEVKTISARWPSGIRSGAVFAMPTAGH